mgnify:CR=1 FL=1
MGYTFFFYAQSSDLRKLGLCYFIRFSILKDLAFCSPCHFIGLFRENAGCTPVKWRKTEVK